MTITLSGELLSLAESKAKAAGFADVAEFVAHAISSYEEEDELPEAVRDGVNSKDELEQKLLAALDSPAEVVTPEYWRNLLKRVEDRAVVHRKTVG